MAWTSPMTAVARDIWTSPQFNAHVRDNLLATMPGVATAAGQHFVTTGANVIAPRAVDAAVVVTSETTTSATYTDLTTPGPAVTVTTGTRALVWLGVEMSSSMSPGGGTAQTVTTYSATGTATFQGGGTNRSDGLRMYQGNDNDGNGNQFAMALFPGATMRSDMANASVSLVELFLENAYWNTHSGSYVQIGTHNQTSLTGSHTYAQVTPNRDSEFYSYGQAKYVTIPNSIGEDIRDNLAQGIAIGQGLTDSESYYGIFTGSTSPKLRITYTKPGVGGYCVSSFAVSGASTLAASDQWSVYSSGVKAGDSNRIGACHLVTGLTAGSNTFTMKYAAGSSGATGTFQRREIGVLPL